MISINANIAIFSQSIPVLILLITSNPFASINLAPAQIVEPTLKLASGLDGRLVYTLADNIAEVSKQDRQQVLSPGHYEFEVAPNLEPPSVRKPPYKQSSQQCPGSGE